MSGRVAILAGRRTPFARAGTAFETRTALALAVRAVDGLLDHAPVAPGDVDELVFGVVTPEPRVYHFAREVVFASRLPAETRGLTVVDNCITGVSAMTAVADSIRAGRAEVGVAGGAESMSNPPLLFRRDATRRFAAIARARGIGERLRLAAGIRPWHFAPQPPAIVEPSTGLSMGEHCELMVKEWGVAREEQDAVALRSHRNAAAATADGRLTAEIVPLDGVDRDLMVRADASAEGLARLRPVFDRSPSGTITAGSSSPLTDGAAAVLLASERHVERDGLEPLAWLAGFETASIDPSEGLLMAPCVAVPRLLARLGLSLADLDIVEMHEAFGGQVLCNLLAWERGWKEPAIGAVDRERLNPLGGSIAIGHPFAATGARIVTTLAGEMARRGARRGLVSICGAGATAAAVVLERR